MRFSRYHRNSGGSRVSLAILATIVGVIVFVGVVPAGSFTLADLPRTAGTDVVGDVDGTLGLDVAASVQQNRIERLVDVTNNLGRTVTVTITVTNSNRHDLYVDGTNHGSTATFSLGDGATQQVDVEAHARENQVVFDVTATTTGLSVTANGRSTDVTGGGQGGGG